MSTSYASASLYVGDLHPDVAEALMFELFNQVGPVSSIRVCRDAITRRSLGYAYVNFHNVNDAERALDTLNYTAVKGKPIRIMWSHRDPSIRKSGVGNIFIKNLDKAIDNKALYDTFSAFGNILSCKVSVDERSGESKGYGFVHYETAEAAQLAIEKVNQKLLNGKMVYVGVFQKRGDRSKDQTTTRFTNVYIKNLPESWDDKKLQEEFGKFGPITSASIMSGQDAKSKGFGFVNFGEPEHALACVEEMNEKEMDGKTLYVGRAQKKAEREAELRKRFEEMKQERINKYQGVNLYVKNLDDTIDDEKLRGEFSTFGTITSAKIMRDEKGISKGFGFVCFTTPDEATKAVTEMNGKMILNKPIYVALAQRRDVRRAQLEAHHAQRQNGAMRVPQGMPGAAPMYGAPMFYGQPNMPPQQRNFVYPQQMMRPRWPAPQQGRPGYPVPGYMGGMPGQQQRQRQNNRQRPGQPAPPAIKGQAPQAQGVAGKGQRGFKYTSTARNQNQAPAAQQNMPQGAASPQEQQQLTLAALAEAAPAQQKQMLGEHLFPLIHAIKPDLAGKITGMLLEMDNGELLHLLESKEALTEKVNEALDVLAQHAQATGDGLENGAAPAAVSVE
eukprot:GFYU01001002.1.p1 GENE.GFYU01001002.1~~GFYU01001002.1.p1  ORF type:complete len:615 (-),score=237.21 GFYU01001002.1:434-2278(-)